MFLAIVITIVLLSSCSVQEDRSIEPIFLSGEQVDIGPEETLFEIVYVNDTVLVAHLLSDLRKLKMYNQRHPGDSYEFLHIGRGPFEVNQCAVKSRADTLYVMSYTPVGIQGVITIPVCRTDDKSAWRYEDISEAADVPMGGDFDVLQGQYIVLGDKYGQPNILSSITRGADDVSVTPLSWWPQDKYNGWRFRSKGPQKTDDYFGVKPPKKDPIINKKGRELGSRASIFRSIATQLS